MPPFSTSCCQATAFAAAKTPVRKSARFSASTTIQLVTMFAAHIGGLNSLRCALVVI
jgi:hypothetical protein